MPNPTIQIDPPHCNDHEGKHYHADPKSKNGYVKFHATQACTVSFENSKVFGKSCVDLTQGSDTKLNIQVENGSTKYYIDKCPRERGNPNDIVVP
jgi:hypothetical protein